MARPRQQVSGHFKSHLEQPNAQQGSKLCRGVWPYMRSDLKPADMGCQAISGWHLNWPGTHVWVVTGVARCVCAPDATAGFHVGAVDVKTFDANSKILTLISILKRNPVIGPMMDVKYQSGPFLTSQNFDAGVNYSDVKSAVA